MFIVDNVTGTTLTPPFPPGGVPVFNTYAGQAPAGIGVILTVAYTNPAAGPLLVYTVDGVTIDFIPMAGQPNPIVLSPANFTAGGTVQILIA